MLAEFFSAFSSAFIAMFVIIDPFAVVPVYLFMTERFAPEDRKRIRAKASWVALLLLVGFALTGTAVFRFFGITLPAFQIAGGLLLLRFGLAQLNADRTRVRPSEQSESLSRDDVSVFPLAMPLLAGPGAISTVVLQASKATSYMLHGALILGVVAAMLATYWTLKFAPLLYKILGQTGLNLLTRIMGIILTAIAVQFVLNGLQAALPILKSSLSGS